MLNLKKERNVTYNIYKRHTVESWKIVVVSYDCRHVVLKRLFIYFF